LEDIISVILITDDIENKEKAQKAGLEAYRMIEYLDFFEKDMPELMELIVDTHTNHEVEDTCEIYEEVGIKREFKFLVYKK
jgi:hypothetical protein